MTVNSDRLSVRSLLPSPMRKWPRSSLTTVVLHGGRPKLYGIMVDSFYVRKPVVIPQLQFLDRLLRLLDEACGDSTGAGLGQGDVRSRRAENCELFTVAVLRRC